LCFYGFSTLLSVQMYPLKSSSFRVHKSIREIRSQEDDFIFRGPLLSCITPNVFINHHVKTAPVVAFDYIPKFRPTVEEEEQK